MKLGKEWDGISSNLGSTQMIRYCHLYNQTLEILYFDTKFGTKILLNLGEGFNSFGGGQIHVTHCDNYTKYS